MATTIDMDDAAADAAFRKKVAQANRTALQLKADWLRAKERAAAAKKAFESSVERLQTLIARDATELPLFDGGDEDEDAIDADLESVLESESDADAEAQADPQVEAPEPAWHSVPLASLPRSKAIAEKLAGAGIATLGDFDRRIKNLADQNAIVDRCGITPKAMERFVEAADAEINRLKVRESDHVPGDRPGYVDEPGGDADADAWRRLPLVELGLDVAVGSKLEAAGTATLGDLAEDVKKGNAALARRWGVGGADVARVRERFDDWRLARKLLGPKEGG